MSSESGDTPKFSKYVFYAILRATFLVVNLLVLSDPDNAKSISLDAFFDELVHKQAKALWNRQLQCAPTFHVHQVEEEKPSETKLILLYQCQH